MKNLLFLLLLSACQGQLSPSEELNEQLINCWTHAYEEDVDTSIFTFKTCDSQTFAPSRYRFTFELMKDGTCEYLVLAENDAHYNEKGTWKLDETEMRLSILDVQGSLFADYKIISINDEVLMLSLVD